MNCFFGGLNEDPKPSELGIVRCPFLRNVNEPTNFSFSSSMPFMPVRAGKGPIFEDGTNFDMAFKLFHGHDGVVPLSERSVKQTETVECLPTMPKFNPLAARAATISLSSFGLGRPFGFDAFSEKWKNQKKKSESNKKDSSSKGGNSKHESMSDEWLQKGNCPIAKSYRAVSSVIPLVAKVLQPPPGMNLKCPPAIVAARAALNKTAFTKNLRPQPLPSKILVIGMLGMALNIPLGIWREHTEKFSPSWFAAVHAAVPFIAMLRKSVLMPKAAMAFTIAASVLGQLIGSRAERYRLKAAAVKTLTVEENAAASLQSFGIKDGNCGKLGVKENAAASLQSFGIKDGNCGKLVEWNPAAFQNAIPSSSTDVFC